MKRRRVRIARSRRLFPLSDRLALFVAPRRKLPHKALYCAEDVFGDDSDLWGSVLQRKGGAFKLIATMPEDPSLN